MIREAIGKRAVNGLQGRAAEAEDGGQVRVAMLPGEPQGGAEEPPDSAPPSSGSPGSPGAGPVDQHPVIVAMRNLEAAVHNLKLGELDPLRARRLAQRLSEIRLDLVARSQPHAPAGEGASWAKDGSPRRALHGDGPAQVHPAIEVARG